jgi:hypothetical protein
MEYLWAWGTLIHEKNLRSKILCQTPFNIASILSLLASLTLSFSSLYNNLYVSFPCFSASIFLLTLTQPLSFLSLLLYLYLFHHF